MGHAFDLKKRKSLHREHSESFWQRDEKETPRLESSSRRKKPLYYSVWRIFFYFLIFFIIGSLTFLGWQAFLESKTAKLWSLLADGKYLVLVLNNAELRPGGGFIGSYGIIEIKDKTIEKIDFNTNIFKLDNAFIKKNYIAPPTPLLKVTKGAGWSLHDANWSADFKDSSEKVLWFLEKEAGEKVDGVIAVDTTLFTDLLQLSGPIALPAYNTTITPENFLTTVQYKVEREYWQKPGAPEENAPKTILKDMIFPFFNALMTNASKREIVKTILSTAEEKHLLFYLKDQTLQSIVEKENWGGRLFNGASDYLYIVEANLGGGKSSLNLERSYYYEVNKNDKGQYIAKLFLNYIHTGTGVWPDDTNRSYIRVLTSDKSQLTSASNQGKDITRLVDVGTEAGKSSFGFWIEVAPGQSQSYVLTYTLPTMANYDLLVQKQPGAPASFLKVVVEGNILYEGMLKKDLILPPNP